jgi:peptide-methionine (R)-S-oxide reductase
MHYRHPDADRVKPAQSASGHSLSLRPEEKEKLAAALSEAERRVLLLQGTEPPFCGGYLEEKGAGVYHCRLCALPLYASADKFDSGSGWPSFTRALDPDHLRYVQDDSHGMSRIELRCARCDGHLGHVFPDGPPPSGWRHCVNSLSLRFESAR